MAYNLHYSLYHRHLRLRNQIHIRQNFPHCYFQNKRSLNVREKRGKMPEMILIELIFLAKLISAVNLHRILGSLQLVQRDQIRNLEAFQ